MRDTTYGFYNLYDWNMSVSMNTTLYGFYKPWKKLFGEKIQVIRHVLKPTVSFSYSPDFTTDRYGYYDTYVKTDANGEVSTVRYSPYQGLLYGFPNGTKSGSISFGISNNIEMKVKSDRDTTGFRKISLVDELSANMSYNLAAKTRPWSDLNMRVRLKLSKRYTFSLNAVFATYAYEKDENGNVRVGDKTEWSQGRFGRFQGMSQNLSYTLNNQTFSKLLDFFRGKKRTNTTESDDTDNDTETTLEDANVDPDLIQARKSGKKKKEKATLDADGYLAFSMPWSLTFGYGVTMRENTSGKFSTKPMRYPYKYTQTLNVGGNLRLSDGLNISFSSGYDFENKAMSMTTASLQRDLHCFNMSCSVVLAPYTSYNFSFRCNASTLTDALKYDKRSGYSNAVQWY